MSKPRSLAIGLAIVWLASCVAPAFAQKLDATVLYRQNSDNGYTALVPGHSAVDAVDCAGDVTNEACSGSAQAGAASGEPALNVTGTTLSLLLPDGRVAVVNCLNKYSYKGTYINRRTCALPLVEHVEADINGQNAKLKWPVGPDGRKIESETYRIVALLDKR